MSVGIILVFIAILYVLHYRSTSTLKMMYASVGLLIAGVVCFVVFAVIIGNTNFASAPSTTPSDIALEALQASLIAVPSGIIMTIITTVLHQKRKR